MAIPELLLPSSLPDFKAGTHVITPEPLYSPVPRQGGTDRRRRVFTSTPRQLQAELEVDQVGLETFFAWYEGALQAGAASFAAKVAKVGAGAEYWEACGLQYTAEHGEGGLHIIRLTARLKGTPSDTAPTSTTLRAEAACALSVYLLAGYEYALTAEAVAALDFAGITGADLAAEAVARLATEFAGPLSGVPLSAEAYAGLEMFGITIGSDDLAAEASAGLSWVLAEEIALSAEASAALAFDVAGLLGFTNPADFTVSSTGSPYKGTVRATVRVDPDGRVYRRYDTGAYAQMGSYYLPTLTSVGNLLWIRARQTVGTGPSVLLAFDTAYQFDATNPKDWGLAQAFFDVGTGPLTTTVVFEIATDPDFLSIVSTWTVDLNVEYL